MARPIYRRGPRRLIEKKVSVIDTTVMMAVTDLVIDTNDDPRTLVRIIVKGSWSGIATGKGSFLIHRAPQGTVVGVPVAGPALQMTPGKEWIYQESYGCVKGVDESIGQKILVDIKAMRKLDKNDEIVFSTIGNGDNDLSIMATVTMFFKES